MLHGATDRARLIEQKESADKFESSEIAKITN